MVRFWWRYANLVSYYAPSRSLDQYCVDFAIAAIGISAVFFFSRPDRWALCYAAVYLLLPVKDAQLAATLDPVAYGRRKDYYADLKQIRRKIPSHLLRAAIFGVIWLVCHVTGNNKIWVLLCAGVFLMIFFIFIRKNPYDIVVSKRGIPPRPTVPHQDRAHAESRRAKRRGRVKKRIRN
jgi:hypothetical protein